MVVMHSPMCRQIPVSGQLSRPVRAYDKWVNRMPREYARSLLGDDAGPYPPTPDADPHALATIEHYRRILAPRALHS